MNFLPNKVILRQFVHYVLLEDISYNDVTTELIVSENCLANAKVVYRNEGIVCGLPFVRAVFDLLGTEVNIEEKVKEGEFVSSNTSVCELSGSAKAILTAERTILNILQKASGVATKTNSFVKEIAEYSAKLTDTRKTTPGSRLLEKYAIRLGGAYPHRYNLSDCILIKDNHIQIAGSVSNAVALARKYCSHTTKIEVETENKEQVIEALNCNADIIMLDNMSIELLEEMVSLIKGQAITEASGNVNIHNIKSIAQTGVNYISTSSITMGAFPLDIGLDM